MLEPVFRLTQENSGSYLQIFTVALCYSYCLFAVQIRIQENIVACHKEANT